MMMMMTVDRLLCHMASPTTNTGHVVFTTETHKSMRPVLHPDVDCPSSVSPTVHCHVILTPRDALEGSRPTPIPEVHKRITKAICPLCKNNSYLLYTAPV